MERELSTTEKSLHEAEEKLEDTEDATEELGNQVKDTGEKVTTFGDVLKANLASEMIIEGVKKIAEGVEKISSASVNFGADFEASMSQVAATMGMTSKEIEGGSTAYTLLADSAKECGKNTKYSASEAGEALNYLALAGYDAQKAAATLPAVLNLASAGGMDLAYASDLVTDSMAALGMETGQLDRYIDEMARTAQKSNTSVAQLGEATLVCAGTVSLTEQSMETMNAELGILANNGYKGAEGGTHLRNILLSLVSPTDKASISIGQLGLKVTDSNGKVRDLNDIMTDLNGSLSQMSSSEKTQIISKIFNKTDIAAVNALLKGTGDEFDTLKQQIIESSGAASDMAETMNNNLKGKITILNSALEGLGITAYEKIDGMLKESVESATEAVGRLQSSMESGRLGESVDKFTDSLGDAAESAIRFAEDALPGVIDGFAWLLDNSNLVIAGISGIAAANIQMKVVGPAINIVTAAWKAYKIENEKATVSQWALNAAMNANPAGILVGAITAVVAAVATLAVTSQKATDEYKASLQVYEDSRNKILSNTENRKANAETMQIEAEMARTLSAEIAALNAKESLSAEEKAKMAIAVEKLNAVMPESNLQINEQNGKLMESNEELDEYINNLLEAAEAQRQQEEIKEITEDLVEAQANLAEIEKDRQKNLEELSQMEQEYADSMDATLGEIENTGMASEVTAQKLNEQYTAIKLLKENDEAYRDELEKQQEVINDLNGSLDNMAEQIQETNSSVQEAASYQVYYKDRLYEIPDATATTISAIENLNSAYAEAKEKAVESIDKQVGVFQELSAQSELTVQQMSENLQSQTEVFSQYSDDLVKASQIASEGSNPEFSAILENITALGLDGAGYLHELVTAAEEDSEAFAEAMESWAEMEDAKETLTDTLADVQTHYSEQMDELLGIADDKYASYQEQTEAAVGEVKQIVTDNNDEIVQDTGESLEEISTTLDEQKPIVVEKMRIFSEELVSTTETTLNIVDGKSLRFKTIGKSITDGIAEGIKEGTSTVGEALKSMIENAVSSMDISGIAAQINRQLGNALR